MRFVARKPREGINVSDTHPLAEAGTLVLGLSLIFVAIVLALVFIVELVLLYVSPETEAELFSNWTPDDLVSIVADDERLIETRALAARLARHWPDSPYAFRVEISDSEEPNAIAFPGGLIIVTTALLDRVETENELAFVLGHELGHFRNRDHMRMLGRTVILGIFFAALTVNDGGANFGVSIADLTLRGFSRDQESAADDFGLEIVYSEYDHVNESWRFFDRIIADDRGNSGLATYIATHPSAGNRIEDLKLRARMRGWPLAGALTDLAW
jgi:Zn-dependent protease with chaperone function